MFGSLWPQILHRDQKANRSSVNTNITLVFYPAQYRVLAGSVCCMSVSLSEHQSVCNHYSSHPPPYIELSFSSSLCWYIYSPQTSQIQALQEGSAQTSLGATPQGPHTLHRDKMTPPPLLLECPRALEHQSLQALEHQSIRAVEHQCIRALEHQSIRSLEQQRIRVLEYQSIRALEYQSI